MFFLKELFNSMARVLGRIIVYIILGFLLFYIFNDRVDAASYKFNNPTLHRICEGSLAANQSGNCITNNYSNEVWANDQPGFWTQVAYRMNTNNNGQTGDYYIADNYSIAFSGYLHVNKSALIDENSIQFQLLYYPTSSNTYGKATCDNGEIFRIEEINTATLKYYYYTYSCETLTITEGKSFIGYEIYVPGFVSLGVDPIPVTIGNQMENNMVIGGPSDTQDIINNFNQNFNDLIFNQNQNQQQTNQGLQDIEDALLDSSQPNLDNFNYTDSTGGLISTFLTMPITLLRVMNNVDSCRSITLGDLFGTPLRFDCINPGVFLGETLWTIIDYFIVFTMITSISQLFIYVYEKFKNLDDFFNEFYTPQHMAPGEYIPRHGGGK